VIAHATFKYCWDNRSERRSGREQGREKQERGRGGREAPLLFDGLLLGALSSSHSSKDVFVVKKQCGFYGGRV
jgi:hypothetical protein